MQTDRRPILVLGVGNTLQRDDGVGVHAVREMQKLALPPEVELVDGGVAGFDLLGFVEDRRKLIVIDAVDGGQEAGVVYRFAPAEANAQPGAANSLHQIGLLETLQMAELIGKAPESTIIYGVQPQIVDWGLALSQPVASSLPRVIDAVLTEIAGCLEESKEINPSPEKAG